MEGDGDDGVRITLYLGSVSCLVTVAAVCACVVTSLLVAGAPDLLQGAGPDLLAHNQTWHHWDLVQAAYQVDKHFQATL